MLIIQANIVCLEAFGLIFVQLFFMLNIYLTAKVKTSNILFL